MFSFSSGFYSQKVFVPCFTSNSLQPLCRSQWTGILAYALQALRCNRGCSTKAGEVAQLETLGWCQWDLQIVVNKISSCWQKKGTSGQDFLKVIDRKPGTAVSQHIQTSVPRKWRCWVLVVTLKLHLNEAAVMLPSAQQGTGFSMTECALLFVFSALSLNGGTGRWSLGLAEGFWSYWSTSEKWETKVWLWCVDFGGCVLFFQKCLVTLGIKAENWAKGMVFLQKFSWTIGPFKAFQILLT